MALRSDKFKFKTEDYNADLNPNDVTVIIFVRHGTSCANVRKETRAIYRVLDRFYILDPGLTRKGIYDARKNGMKLRGKLISNYGKITPIVYASVLLRTQMTGYLMMNPDLTKGYKVHILPYISETGAGDDNKPRNFDDQTKMLEELKPVFENIVRVGYTGYKGDKQPDKLKPDFPMFIEELKKLCRDNKENKIKSVTATQCSVKNKIVNISERDTRTAYAPIVIVTHGHVLEEFFETMGRKLKDKSERPNFAAFRVYFNNATGNFIKNPIDTSDKNKKNHKQMSYFYPYDDKLKSDLVVRDECDWEKAHQACESDVCDPHASASSTKYIGGRTRRKVRGKAQRRTQKNS